MKSFNILIISLFAIMSTSIYSQVTLTLAIAQISSEGIEAEAPFLTMDNNDNPVLCWTEKDLKTRKYYLSFARWNKIKKSFCNPHKVMKTLGMQKHHESMAKIGFKKNGTIFIIFGVKKPTPKNRFAGYTAFIWSTDDGVSWSNQERLVVDTSSQSQRFFDVARLPDGELGISWLDARKVELDKDGSSLYFAKTDSNNNIVSEKAIAGSTCQCCRTEIYVEESNVIHVAFRDIIQDSIRDMMHLYSSDNGMTFSKPMRISEDNWIINGCPHTGPTLATYDGKMAYAWYTMGGGEGVYFARATTKNKMDKRQLVSNRLYHPQMITNSDQFILLVGDEENNIGDIYYGKICLYVINEQNHFKKYYIQERISNNNHPVIAMIGNDIIIAWTQNKKKNNIVNYTYIESNYLK